MIQYIQKIVLESDLTITTIKQYRIAGNFHGVLIFVIFVINLLVTKFSINAPMQFTVTCSVPIPHILNQLVKLAPRKVCLSNSCCK